MTISPLAAGVVLTLSREELPAGRPFPGRHCSSGPPGPGPGPAPHAPHGGAPRLPRPGGGAGLCAAPGARRGPPARGALLTPAKRPPATEVAGGRFNHPAGGGGPGFFW